MNEKQLQAIEKLRSDLMWRGRESGKAMGHIVMPRDLAQELLSWIEQQVLQITRGVEIPGPRRGAPDDQNNV